MNYQTYIPEALEIVSAWDIELEDFAQVVNDQARLMAATDLDLITNADFDNPYWPLQF